MNQEQAVILDIIKDFADQAHGDQVRKYIPHRYIVHPTKVMERCSKYTNDFATLAAALLHDVLEDTPVTLDELSAFLKSVTDQRTANKIVNIVVELTDVYTQENFPYLSRRQRRLMEAARLEHVSKEAQLIKYADIMDNTNEIVEYDPCFATIYLQECMEILHKMVKGNVQLHYITVQKLHARLKRCKFLSGLKVNREDELPVVADVLTQ